MTFKYFSEQDIKDLYNKYVVKDNEYYESHKNLFWKVSSIIPSNIWNSIDKDYPRLPAIVDLYGWLNKYNLNNFDSVLSTCRGDPELYFIKSKQTDFAEYDGTNFDLHMLDLPKKDYDFIMVNQTLEHLYNPTHALERLYNHIKPGGYFFTSVPFINIPHNMPFHYWGINPLGLTILCKTVGFEVMEVGFYGSREYVVNMFYSRYWPGLNVLKETQNDPFFTAQCWILCKKN
jgi:SAM-dependent methyltransferase